MNPDIYTPTLSEATAKALQTARTTNTERDAIDRAHGAGAPQDGPLDVHLRTAIEAIATGMNLGDMQIIAEGLAMVQDAEVRARIEEPQ